MIIDSKIYAGACACGREHPMDTKLSVVEAGCLKDLDAYIAQCGLSGFRTVVYDRNTPNASKHILPYVRHYEELLSDGTWHYYTETVDCMYGPGWVEFNYRASDFAYEDNVNINPTSMQFSIVITREDD